MNWYRNAHYFELNKVKQNYVINIKDKTKYDRVIISYTMYTKDKKRRDLFNFVSIVDKILLDRLVKFEIIPDDSIFYVEYDKLKYGGLSDDNYIIAEVKGLKNE